MAMGMGGSSFINDRRHAARRIPHSASHCGFVASVSGLQRSEQDRGQPMFFEDLSVGMTASFGKTVSEADILMFAAVSGDTNPVHINAEIAAASMFKQRIAHGMLSAGLISAVLGTRLPGEGSIYLSQNLKFRAPVKIGDTVTATVEITALDPGKKRVTLSTICTVAGKPVIEGEATVMVPSRG